MPRRSLRDCRKVLLPRIAVKAMWRLDIGQWRPYVFGVRRSAGGEADRSAFCECGQCVVQLCHLESTRAKHCVREEEHAENPRSDCAKPCPAIGPAHCAQKGEGAGIFGRRPPCRRPSPGPLGPQRADSRKFGSTSQESIGSPVTPAGEALASPLQERHRPTVYQRRARLSPRPYFLSFYFLARPARAAVYFLLSVHLLSAM